MQVFCLAKKSEQQTGSGVSPEGLISLDNEMAESVHPPVHQSSFVRLCASVRTRTGRSFIRVTYNVFIKLKRFTRRMIKQGALLLKYKLNWNFII